MNENQGWYTSRMQIVIDARMLLPHETGVGRYLEKLAQILPTLPGDESYEFWLQAGLPKDNPIWGYEGERSQLRRLPINQLDARAQWIIPGELRKLKPQLYHCPHFDLPFFVPGKTIVTIYDLKYIARPGFFPHVSHSKRAIMWAMMAFSVHRAERVIAISEFTRQDLIQRFKVKPGKVSVVHLGVDRNFFQSHSTSKSTSSAKDYGLGNNYILSVGERRPHKNLVGLIKSFNIFQKMVKEPFQLVIAGKPYSDYTLPEQTVEQLGLGNRVRFLDYVPYRHLPALYRGAQAVVYISEYEGFGLVPLESMAAGTPVVAGKCTAIPEVVGDAVILVPPDDPEQVAAAIQKLVMEQDLRAEYIARGYERVKGFGWEKTAKDTLAVYQETLSA